MKYLGKEISRPQFVKEVEYIRCDCCDKKIEDNYYIELSEFISDGGKQVYDLHKKCLFDFMRKEYKDDLRCLDSCYLDLCDIKEAKSKYVSKYDYCECMTVEEDDLED